MVKMGTGLSRPIPVQQGIRESLPISGQLYSIAIEPLLCQLRGRLSSISLPGSSYFDRPLTVSAYADDVYIFVSSQERVHWLQDTMTLYEKASSAWVNWVKRDALLLGQWQNQAVPSLPGGLVWGKEGLKVLGGSQGVGVRLVV